MRVRGHGVGFLGALVVWLVSSGTSAQQVDPTVRAAELANDAAEAYQDGDVEGAIRLFHEAMVYVRDPAFAFNLAQLYDSLSQKEPAYRFYQEYLELYPAAPNRGSVEARIGELVEELNVSHARMVVRTDPDGAEVSVLAGTQRIDYGPAPVDNYVPPGSVTIMAGLDGYEPVSTTRTAVAGVRLEVGLELRPLGHRAQDDTVVDTPPVQTGGDGVSALTITGWVMVVLGAGLTGTGTYYWLDAASKESDHNEYVRLLREGETVPVTLAELRQLGEDAGDSATLGNLLGIPGVVVLAGGVVILVIEALSDEGPASIPVAGPLLFPGGLGLGFSGRF